MKATVILEIGNPWLKIAVVRSVLGTVFLKSFVLENAAQPDEAALSRQIAGILKANNAGRPKELIVSYSRNTVTLRNLRIPSANPGEIGDMIKLHVGRQVPYAKEEIISGYRVMGRDSMGYAKVMLAIVHRESVRRLYRVLEKAGVAADRMELSSDGILFWLARAARLAEAKSSEAFIILDIDATFTDFIIATADGLLFSRVIASGTEQMRDETKWPKFIGELKQTLVISQGEEIAQRPTRIYLTGTGPSLSRLSETIETEFNMPVQAVTPLTHMPVGKDVSRAPADLFEQASFSALLGLGLDTTRRAIGFVLPEAQIRRTLRERSREAILFGSAAMYLILISCGVYIEKMHNRQLYRDVLVGRYEQISSRARDLEEKVERLRQIKSKQDTKSVALNYVLEVSRLLPSELVVTSLTYQKDESLIIKGRAAEMSDIFKFITTLDGSTYFKEVQTRYTTRKKVKGQDINEFEIAGLIDAPKAAKKKRTARSRSATEAP